MKMCFFQSNSFIMCLKTYFSLASQIGDSFTFSVPIPVRKTVGKEIDGLSKVPQSLKQSL